MYGKQAVGMGGWGGGGEGQRTIPVPGVMAEETFPEAITPALSLGG